MEIYAFVGPSGTGKSHRAQMLAKTKNIEYIIDDAILIKGNRILCGMSAKKSDTKIEAVKRALFSLDNQAEEMKKVLSEEKPEKLLILGTSDDMIKKIIKNLELPELTETIRIEDVSTPAEIEQARSARMSGGKHVIPVPTFELKKNFSGYLLDPLQVFRWSTRDAEPMLIEKSIIRPTFSYLGKYKISDSVFKTIIQYHATSYPVIYKISRIQINTKNEGIYIYIDVIVEYGMAVKPELIAFKRKITREIDRTTSMNVIDIIINAKGLHVEKK